MEEANGASGSFTPTRLWSHICLIPQSAPGGDSVRRRFCCFRRKIGSEQPPAGWATAELSRRSVQICEPVAAELHRRAATPPRGETRVRRPQGWVKESARAVCTAERGEAQAECTEESRAGGPGWAFQSQEPQLPGPESGGHPGREPAW